MKVDPIWPKLVDSLAKAATILPWSGGVKKFWTESSGGNVCCDMKDILANFLFCQDGCPECDV
jgi:hypothetical protein